MYIFKTRTAVLAAALTALALLAACGGPAPGPDPTAAPTTAPTAAPTEAPWNDVCDLYWQVLEDLWAVDPGLNSDISAIGLDLSTAPGDLSEAQKDELAARFGAAHGCEVTRATWQELADAGIIDAEALYWEDGCLFTIRANDDAAGEPGTGTELHFDAQKWRSGLGAYFFGDCTAKYTGGGWQYSVGCEAIA